MKSTKRKTTSDTQETQYSQSGWIEIVKDWIIENAKDITMNTLKELQNKVEEFFSNLGANLSRTIFASFTMFSGLVFMMIGLSILINDLVGISDSIGYIFIGFIVVLVGMFANKNI